MEPIDLLEILERAARGASRGGAVSGAAQVWSAAFGGERRDGIAESRCRTAAGSASPRSATPGVITDDDGPIGGRTSPGCGPRRVEGPPRQVAHCLTSRPDPDQGANFVRNLILFAIRTTEDGDNDVQGYPGPPGRRTAQRHRLKVAVDLARRHGAHLTGIFVLDIPGSDLFYGAGMPYAGGGGMTEMVNSLRAEPAARADAMAAGVRRSDSADKALRASGGWWKAIPSRCSRCTRDMPI